MQVLAFYVNKFKVSGEIDLGYSGGLKSFLHKLKISDTVYSPPHREADYEAIDSIPNDFHDSHIIDIKDTLKPYLDSISDIEEKDTITSVNEKQYNEKLNASDDSVKDKEHVQYHPEPDSISQPDSAKIHKKSIDGDSVYKIKSSLADHEKDSVVPTVYEPAVNYFGEHKLKPQKPITEKAETTSTEWAFPFLIFALLLFAVAKYYFFRRLRQMISATYATRLFNQMERDGNIFNELVSILLFANFGLVFSMFVFQTLDYFSVFQTFVNLSPVKIIFLFISLIIFFFLIKYYVLRFLGWLFKAIVATVSYFKNIIIFNILIGLILLPIVFINAFNPSYLLIYAGWGIFFIANLVKIARGVLISYNTSEFSMYYIILYLCAIELAPLLVIAKFSADYIKAL